MKTTIKTSLFLVIAALGFFNLKIDKVTDLKSSLSIVGNSASADGEDPGSGKKYFLKETNTAKVTDTITKPDGSICTTSYDKTTVSCIGEGSVSCTASSTRSNESSTC